VALGVTAADALALSALVRGLAKQDKVAGALHLLSMQCQCQSANCRPGQTGTRWQVLHYTALHCTALTG
jgi:hypothetical protein